MSTTKAIVDLPKDKAVILFDGVCNVCNGFVQFMIPRDPKGYFKFASLQSEIGQQILKAYDLPAEELSTVILVEGGKVYTHSDVAIRASRHMSGLWPAFSIFSVVPRFLRDGIYNWIARNRYRWFGQREQCMIPTPDIRQRFLG